MTTSRDPEKPSSSGKTRPRKARRTPLSRRLRHLVQDSGYAVKKAGRKVADPVRDAREKGEPKSGSEPRRKPKSAAEEGVAAEKQAAAAEKATAKAKAAAEKRAAAKEKAVGKGERGSRKRAPRRRGGRKPKARKPVLRKRRERTRPERRRGVRPARERAPRRASRKRKIARPTKAGVATAITNFGERSSKVIRGAVAPVLPPLLGVAALGRRGLGRLAVALTPLRAALIVSIAAAILLGISQFVDYRGVAVGVPEYAAYTDVEGVAPAPQVDREPAGSAHAYLLVPVAALSILLLIAAARGRWQLGRVVALLGVLAVAVALIVDVPAGLDEGAQAVAYSGVEAQLVEGFWAQLFAGAVLVFGGLLVSRYARKSKRKAARPSRRSTRVARPRASAA